jgi:hypothetical protein
MSWYRGTQSVMQFAASICNKQTLKEIQYTCIAYNLYILQNTNVRSVVFNLRYEHPRGYAKTSYGAYNIVKKLLFRDKRCHDRWVPVTTACRMEERLQLWRVAANILNKQPRTDEKGSSSLEGSARPANRDSLTSQQIAKAHWTFNYRSSRITFSNRDHSGERSSVVVEELCY